MLCASMENNSTRLGKVKWFNAEKGFGFITDSGNSSEYFVHYQDIVTDGFKNLEEFEEVSFEVSYDVRLGVKAVNVIRLQQDRIENKKKDFSEVVNTKVNTISTEKTVSDDIIEFLKYEKENLLRIIGDNHSEFNKGRIYAMDRMIDGLEVIYNNL